MKVEVIIPCYNASRYLDAALCSLALQDFNDFHVTLVNDCSPEGSYEQWVLKYKDFFPIEEMFLTQNVKPGIARQVAIDNTESDYIMFMDADDCLMGPNVISELYNTALKDDADLVRSCIAQQGKEGNIELIIQPNWVWLHGKMYKRKFLEDHKVKFAPFFDASGANEDIGFHGVMQWFNPKITDTSALTYFWRWNNNSLTRKEDFAHTGWRANIINRIWAVKCAQEFNVDWKTISDYVLSEFAGMYFSIADDPNWQEMMESVKEFYETCVQPYVLDVTVVDVDFDLAYEERIKGKVSFTKPVLITWKQFLEEAGAIKDFESFIPPAEVLESLKGEE